MDLIKCIFSNQRRMRRLNNNEDDNSSLHWNIRSILKSQSVLSMVERKNVYLPRCQVFTYASAEFSTQKYQQKYLK